jgi:uncharacterized protein YbaP (TraB family)
MRFARGVFAIVFSLGLAGAAAAQPPVWIAHSGATTILLFGSVHLLPKGLDWRPPALTAAIARADEIWFELPIGGDSDAEAIRLVQTTGLLPAGESLHVLLPKAEDARLNHAGVALGLPPALFDRMRPWLADLTISLAFDAKAGALPDEGVERKLQGLAPATAVRKAFETPTEQIALFADAPLKEQIASLDVDLRDIADDPDSFQRVVNDWMAGDLVALRKEDLEPLRKASPAAYARLITERNQRWAAVLTRRLATPGEVVVVVGVGHLIGPGGVPALLRKAGFTVEGP